MGKKLLEILEVDNLPEFRLQSIKQREYCLNRYEKRYLTIAYYYYQYYRTKDYSAFNFVVKHSTRKLNQWVKVVKFEDGSKLHINKEHNYMRLFDALGYPQAERTLFPVGASQAQYERVNISNFSKINQG